MHDGFGLSVLPTVLDTLKLQRGIISYPPPQAYYVNWITAVSETSYLRHVVLHINSNFIRPFSEEVDQDRTSVKDPDDLTLPDEN